MIVTLTGPTCSGKTTVEAELQKRGFGRAISHTTRPMRSGEVDGTHYHFVTEAEYDHLDRSGKFIETVAFGTAKYAMSGVALQTALIQSDNVAIVVEPHGAHQIHTYCGENGIDAYAVWIDCSPRVQARRWLDRLLGDLLIGKDVTDAYAARLEAMLSVEVEWRQDTKADPIIEHPVSMDYALHLNSTFRLPDALAIEIMRRLRLLP
jgi:guanylate kinase